MDYSVNHRHLSNLLPAIALIALCLLTSTPPSLLVLGQTTSVGFYSSSCPNAESIVSGVVSSYYQNDRTFAPGLLRMHFHDCFVRGCDASVLIDGSSSEKTSPPNLTLRGFEVIDDAKKQLESVCPGVVSCSDILALAARDSVCLAGGPSWDVPTGRRDGFVSSASDALNLPAPTDSVDVQKQKFADVGLNTRDLVALLGGHTIGTAQCLSFGYRLYNFTSDGGPDPTIDPNYLETLRGLCPLGGDETTRVALDVGSEFDFDRSYYYNLQNGRGLLESDQVLWEDESTSYYVSSHTGLLNGLLGGLLGLFGSDFVDAMVKMSNIGVNTGNFGEIRRVCRQFNN